MDRTTIRDVVKKAGVSITTVSKALNDYSDVNPETRQRIREIAEELNYVPNAAGRTMGGKADKVIGLLITTSSPRTPPAQFTVSSAASATPARTTASSSYS